jgi:hypothetical protein
VVERPSKLLNIGIGVGSAFSGSEAYDGAFDDQSLLYTVGVQLDIPSWDANRWLTIRGQAVLPGFLEGDGALRGDLAYGWAKIGGRGCGDVTTTREEVVGEDMQGNKQVRTVTETVRACNKWWALTFAAGVRGIFFEGNDRDSSGMETGDRAPTVIGPQVGVVWLNEVDFGADAAIKVLGRVETWLAFDALGNGAGAFFGMKGTYGKFFVGIDVGGFFSYGGQMIAEIGAAL